MIWRYRKISNGHYDSHYFVCKDAGVIPKTIAIVKRRFCTFDPLPKDADNPDRETIFKERFAYFLCLLSEQLDFLVPLV